MINMIVLLSAFCTCATFDTLDKSYSPELTLSSLSKLKFSSQIKYQITRKKQKSCPRLIGPRCRSFIISVPSGENTPRFLGPPRTALAQVYGLQQVYKYNRLVHIFHLNEQPTITTKEIKKNRPYPKRRKNFGNNPHYSDSLVHRRSNASREGSQRRIRRV